MGTGLAKPTDRMATSGDDSISVVTSSITAGNADVLMMISSTIPVLLRQILDLPTCLPYNLKSKARGFD